LLIAVRVQEQDNVVVIEHLIPVRKICAELRHLRVKTSVCEIQHVFIIRDADLGTLTRRNILAGINFDIRLDRLGKRPSRIVQRTVDHNRFRQAGCRHDVLCIRRARQQEGGGRTRGAKRRGNTFGRL